MFFNHLKKIAVNNRLWYKKTLAVLESLKESKQSNQARLKLLDSNLLFLITLYEK